MPEVNDFFLAHVSVIRLKYVRDLSHSFSSHV